MEGNGRRRYEGGGRSGTWWGGREGRREENDFGSLAISLEK